jgi:predicted phosphoribosyltransferase
MVFLDRSEAGRVLAGKLASYAGGPDVLVLALPRGGVPVAYEVARALDAPLDVFLVRKLGVPGHEELAMGAVASGGVRVLNHAVVSRLPWAAGEVDAVTRRELAELRRQEAQYRRQGAFPDIEDHTVILVDDGLATGSTMRAAVEALRQYRPRRIVVAVPVGAPDTCDQFRDWADDVVCATRPDDFLAVGAYYADFSQTTDEEVKRLLREAAERRTPAATAQEKSHG